MTIVDIINKLQKWSMEESEGVPSDVLLALDTLLSFNRQMVDGARARGLEANKRILTPKKDIIVP